MRSAFCTPIDRSTSSRRVPLTAEGPRSASFYERRGEGRCTCFPRPPKGEGELAPLAVVRRTMARAFGDFGVVAGNLQGQAKGSNHRLSPLTPPSVVPFTGYSIPFGTEVPYMGGKKSKYL